MVLLVVTICIFGSTRTSDMSLKLASSFSRSCCNRRTFCSCMSSNACPVTSISLSIASSSCATTMQPTDEIQRFLIKLPSNKITLCKTHHEQHTHTQPFNGLLSGTTRVGRYQKKHSPTHTHPDHRTSFITFLHLQRSMASFLFSIRAWQSSRTTSLQVLASWTTMKEYPFLSSHCAVASNLLTWNNLITSVHFDHIIKVIYQDMHSSP